MEWKLINKKTQCKTLPPVVARLVANRGVTTDAEAKIYFGGGLQDMHDPALFKDIERGANITIEAIKRGWKIRIIGDYDVDGVCSTAIFDRGLSAIGADVDTAIPHRVKDGYGLNSRLIREAAEDGVKLIITCDNGIGAVEQVALANELGMTVVVTDHHEVPYVEKEDGSREYILPDAFAVIDPKQEDCKYPFKGICGALVAYKFIQYIYTHKLAGASYDNVYADRHFDDELLQLAALATVCDIMELRDENRTLVRYGLEQMTNNPAQGIRQLIEVQSLAGKEITAYHIGFVLGPCINAAGRLDSAERALSLLLCENDMDAVQIAKDLSELNTTRIAMTEASVKAGMELLDSQKVQVVYLPECHESIAGIVAGRLKDASHKPVLVATRTVGRNCKGSARSIEAYPLYHEMTKVKELFQGFGGHALAAGFSMELDKLDELRKRLNANCTLTDRDVSGTISVDMLMHLSDVDADFADMITTLEPFGTGNKKPLFLCPNLRLVRMKMMGKTGKAARLTVKDGTEECEVVTFRQAEALVMGVASKRSRATSDSLMEGAPLLDDVRMSIVYSVSWNEYQGVRSVQKVVEDFILL
jgi:single-stranded-DNA-specific exonuclease